MYAKKNEHKDIIKLLIENGAKDYYNIIKILAPGQFSQ